MEAEQKPRGISARKVLLALIFLVGATSGLILLQAEQAIRRRWQSTVDRIEQLRSEANAESPTRPSLLAPEVTGDAWSCYLPAIRRASRCREVTPFLDFVNRHATADSDLVSRLVHRYSAATRMLRDGARRTEARYRFTHKPSFASPEPRQMGIQQLRFLARSEARLLSEDGDVPEAFRLLGALALFGRDLAHNGWESQESNGIGVMDSALEEIKDILDRQKVSGDTLTSLEHTLKILDDVFPDRRTAIRNNTLLLGLSLLEEERQGRIMHSGPEPRTRHDWRWGFSSRLQVAATLTQSDRWMKEVVRAESLPWLEGEAARFDYYREREAYPDPIVRYAPNLTGGASFWAHTRARLSLLRSRVHVQRTGEILTLDDPYGDVLQSIVTPASVKIWSVGRNGKNETGLPGPPPKYSDDLIIEVSRPTS